MPLIRALGVLVLMFAVVAPVHAGKMAKSKDPIVVEPDKATVVFMRPGKFVGAAVSVPVFDATAETPVFVGLVEAGSKVAYPVAPGERVFMTTVFGGADGVRFYRANVEAGKTYYFRAHIISGIWGLSPVDGATRDGDEFKKWDAATKLTVNTPKSLAWGADNLERTAQRRRELLPAEIPAENTLQAADGR